MEKNNLHCFECKGLILYNWVLWKFKKKNHCSKFVEN